MGAATTHATDLGGVITLPSAQIRLAGRLLLAGREVLLATFPAGSALDVLAVVGWDDARFRLLALEPIAVRAPEGLALSTRLTASLEEPVVRLITELSAPRGPTLPFHLQWIDYLKFRSGAPMSDMPARPPMAGGCQARLAGIRAHVADLLAASPQTVGWDDLAAVGLLEVPHQLALASGEAAYPADMADP
jgi:hypothetical protein